MKMDFKGKELILLGLLILEFSWLGHGNLVFPVYHKFNGRENSSLSTLKSHDTHRGARFLSAVDITLGGNGLPTESGLYYAKIGLGSPVQDFYVHVDTGSDILWVNCAGCNGCPKKTNLGFELKEYDPKSSNTSSEVGCGDDFCIDTYNGVSPSCKRGIRCSFKVTYADGTISSGYFLKDHVRLDQVSGNFQTAATTGDVIFGCGNQQTGNKGDSVSAKLDGLIGFGHANSSMISQLASAGKVKKMFAHCLDNTKGGGIFAIGQVVHPIVSKTTPLVQNTSHYNVALRKIEVGNDTLLIPLSVFMSGSGKGTIIDSGTTFAYLPEMVYEQLMTKIMARQPDLKIQTVQDFTCFEYSENVDEGFPTVTFHFKDSLSLTAYPHDYFFRNSCFVNCSVFGSSSCIRMSPISTHLSDGWCVGWQKASDEMPIIIGDMVLSNKLVVYDVENQAIGWTNYNCTSSIKVKDEKNGAIYSVGAHDISSASSVLISKISSFFLLLIAVMSYFVCYIMQDA